MGGRISPPPRGLVGDLWSPGGVTALTDLPGDEALRRVVRELASHGIVHFRGRATQAQFFAAAEAVGVVWKELFVFVNPAEPMFVRNPRQVPFHTDSIKASVVGWHCLRACSTDVPHRFLDGWDAYDRLDPADRAHLPGLAFSDGLRRVAADDEPTAAVVEPVVEEAGTRLRLFWLPHLVPEVEGPARAAAIARFRDRLQGAGGTRVVETRLQTGQFVLVDNNRFLHGRDAIPATTPRLLYRLWINTTGWPQALLERVLSPTLPGAPAEPGVLASQEERMV